MTLKQLFLSLFVAILASMGLNAQSPVGRWKTIDTETGQAKSIVEIYEKNGKLYGKVQELLVPGQQDRKCTECSGDRKDKPIKGMVILWDLKKKDNYWIGEILEPKSGKTYSCRIEFADVKDPNKLKVRAYVGMVANGSNQYWHRVK